MSQTRIYISPEKVDDYIEIQDKGIIHKVRNVLRLGDDRELRVFDGRGREYIYKIERTEKRRIFIKKIQLIKESCPSKKRVILGFPLLREERIDFILQKATELGVSEFIPFTCQRSIKLKYLSGKLKRWYKIIIEASRQSQRLWIPIIRDIVNLDTVVTSDYSQKFVASINGESPEDMLSSGFRENLVIVGPEGDFSPAEYIELKENNFKFIKLSSNILRVETAAVFTVGLMNYFFSRSP